MSKIITVATTKGGSGKSTIAANIAVCASNDGLKTLLIDTDKQGSTSSFRAIRETDDIKAISIVQPTIHKDIESFSNFDLIIIDAGGKDNPAFRSAIVAAAQGMLLIPILPSQYDIWGAEDTFKMLKEIRLTLTIPTYAVFNRVIPNPRVKISHEAVEAVEEIRKEYEIEMLNTMLYNRVDFQNSVSYGKGVIEYEPGSKSAGEIKSLYGEIRTILGV